MIVQPYVFFNGNCDEAVSFYEKALGAKVGMKMRLGESPDKHMIKPGTENLIMHAQMQIGPTMLLMSDMCMGGTAKHDGFSLSLTVGTEAEAQKYFAALSEGANVFMPLTKTFFSPAFGQLTDKFGVMWMVYVHSAPPGAQ